MKFYQVVFIGQRKACDAEVRSCLLGTRVRVHQCVRLRCHRSEVGELNYGRSEVRSSRKRSFITWAREIDKGIARLKNTTFLFRVCCPQHAQEFGTAVSSFDLMIVRVCSLRNKQTAIIRFRTSMWHLFGSWTLCL